MNVEIGIIGGSKSFRVRFAMRVLQPVPTEGLRRLSQPQRFPVDRPLDKTIRSYLFHRIPHGQRNDRGPLGFSCLYDLLHHQFRHTGPDSVVNDDDVDPVIHNCQSLAHGVLALLPACDHMQHFCEAMSLDDVRAAIVQVRCGNREDNSVNDGGRLKNTKRMNNERKSSDGAKLLPYRAAHAEPKSCSRHEGDSANCLA